MENILKTLTPAVLGMLSLGAVLLFCRIRGNRARRMLAWALLMAAVFFLFQVVNQTLNRPLFLRRDFFSPSSLIIGNIVALVILPYTIEVLKPGWLTWRRGLLAALPFLGCVGLYFLVLWILHEPILKLTGPAHLQENLPQFNVWFRFVFFLVILGYIVAMHGLLLRNEAKYKAWCLDNYSNPQDYEVSWLYYINIALFCLTISFMVLIFTGKPINFVIHQCVFIVLAGFSIYKVLFHENPYPEGFFQGDSKPEEALPATGEEDLFKKRIPEYKARLEEWFLHSKPFLRSGIKLMDVREVLPLNRTYLSRVFNEGFGESFSQVILNARLEEASRLLKGDTDLNVGQIARQCGFQSPSTFNRTFVKKYGQTPKKYRAGA